MPKIFRLIPLVFAFVLASCQPANEHIPQELTFARYQPIFINVSKIQIIDDYKPPMAAPNVDHLIPYSPSDAMHVWVKDRLRAVGYDKTLQVIIKDGSVILSKLPSKGGVEGFLTDSQDRQYDANLVVELRIYGTSAMSEASIQITSHQMVTMRERASVQEREAIFRRMIFRLMDGANAQLEKNIQQYFGSYVNYSMNP